MNDWQSFMLAICERPQDIDLHLVAADWLEEQGDVRGEFIRCQVELAFLESKAGGEHDGRKNNLCDKCCLTTTLRRRERELFEKYGKLWVCQALGIPLK